MNDQNLIPFSERSEDEVREIAARGGVASGRARRKKKLLRSGARIVLASRAGVLNPDITEMVEAVGADPAELTVADGIVFSLARKALTGDPDAIRLLLEMCGESTKEVIAEDRLEFEREQFTTRRADVLRARTEKDRGKLFSDAPSDDELRELVQAERENLAFLDTLENL